MQARRRQRSWVVFLAILALLFQQLALAAYACPIEASALAIAPGPPPCHSDPVVDKSLCHEHCHPTTLTLDQYTPAPILPATLPLAFTLPPALAAGTPRNLATRELRVRAAAPPLILQFCTWLI